MEKLLELYNYFKINKDELVNKYSGQYIVITEDGVVGCFADENEAYYNSVEKYGLGNFIVQICTKNDEAYTQNYNSRVTFV